MWEFAHHKLTVPRIALIKRRPGASVWFCRERGTEPNQPGKVSLVRAGYLGV
jgi:hypothetical protein